VELDSKNDILDFGEILSVQVDENDILDKKEGN
jgi:hypothetical protein